MNRSLNILKCFSAFAVICLHCSLYISGTTGIIIDALARFAVPVFFMISGYYSFFENDSLCKEKYKKRIIKLLILILMANIIYFIYNIVASNSYNNLLKGFNSKITAKNVFSSIIFNVSLTSGHLWFLNALLYCYIIYYILCKFNISPKTLYKHIFTLLLASIMIGEISYFMGIYNSSMYYRNFLFIGLPFFTLGYLIHDNEKKIENSISNRFILIAILLSTALIILERLATGKIEIHIGTILFSIMVFIWCILNPNKLRFKIFEWIGKNLYTSIYILQGIVISILRKYELSMNLSNEQMCYINVIIVFIATTLLSLLIHYLHIFIKKLKPIKIN